MKFKINTPKPKPKKPFNKWLIAIIFIILIVIIFCSYGIYMFLTTYAFRTPVIIQNPIYKIKSNVGVIKTVNKNKSVVFDVGKIADQIYKWESSSGKNDACRNMGMYNGYGFGQDSKNFLCFKTPEEVRLKVIEWLTKNIDNGNIEEALCYYNRGIRQNGCSYALKFDYE